MPNSNKQAVVVEPAKTTFAIVRVSDNSKVYCGEYSDAAQWQPSGETVRIADFSEFKTPGDYYLLDSDVRQSHQFKIDGDVFADVHAAALKAFYFTRASSALEAQYAGQWQRPLGHPDTQVFVHPSAATNERPEGTVISAPKGWYDAGDYNKYIVNSGISVFSLLAAYEQFSDVLNPLDVNIPESGDAVPDVLDEVKWNLDWMVAMQDTDGGVYHKLTDKNWAGEMPHQTSEQRYVVQKGTGATLNFAASMAVAARVYAPFEASFPGLANSYRSAAERAWRWAQANPSIAYQQPEDVVTGEYGDETFNDEFAWAAAELFLLTGNSTYLDAFKNNQGELISPWWAGVEALGVISLAYHGENKLSSGDYQALKTALIGLADHIVAKYQSSAYRVAMTADDFVWGSNSVVLNQAMMLINAYRLSNKPIYLTVANAQLDYVLGRNATGFSFVTGFGAVSPQNIHHRPSQHDGIAMPVPGLLAGGPHAGQQDKPTCDRYQSNLPAKAYVDHYCSYATNEVAINWNAPLVYVLSALRSF